MSTKLRPTIEQHLQLAAENCHLKVARLLIVAWADVDKATIDTGTTPLHFAAESGQVEMLRLLTEAGADINKARTIDGAITLAEWDWVTRKRARTATSWLISVHETMETMHCAHLAFLSLTCLKLSCLVLCPRHAPFAPTNMSTPSIGWKSCQWGALFWAMLGRCAIWWGRTIVVFLRKFRKDRYLLHLLSIYCIYMYLFHFIPLIPRVLKSAMGMYSVVPYPSRVAGPWGPLDPSPLPGRHGVGSKSSTTAAASPGFHCWITILFFKLKKYSPAVIELLAVCFHSAPPRNPVMVLGGPFCGLNPPFCVGSLSLGGKIARWQLEPGEV